MKQVHDSAKHYVAHSVDFQTLWVCIATALQASICLSTARQHDLIIHLCCVSLGSLTLSSCIATALQASIWFLAERKHYTQQLKITSVRDMKFFAKLRIVKTKTHDACRVASPRRKFRITCKQKDKTPNPRILLRQRGVNSGGSRLT